MAVQTDDFVAQLKQQILSFQAPTRTVDVGTVLSVGDGIARLSGLTNARAAELVEFENGTLGIVFNLEADNVGVIIMGEYSDIAEGQLVRRTGRIVSVPVGTGMIGRVINAVGQPIDGKGPIATDKFRPIERIAPNVVTRKSVDTPVQTGIKAIDAMIPIGRGQRELIIGDRQTGKTALAVDTIINQKGQDLICIYVAIGQRQARSPRWSPRWRSSARWSTRSSSRPPPPSRPRCSTSRPTPAAPSARSSWSRARTR